MSSAICSGLNTIFQVNNWNLQHVADTLNIKFEILYNYSDNFITMLKHVV